MSLKAHRPSLFVAALSALVLAGCGNHASASGASGDIAIVNGEAISNDEYYRYLERKPVVQVAVAQQVQPGQAVEMQVSAPLGFQALRDLINRRILVDVARDEKVMPTEKDISDELAFQRGRQPDFMQKLTAQGLTLDDIKRDLTIDLAKEKILTKGITETKKDAEDYIKAHPEQFMAPEQARLIVVIVKDEAGQKQVDADLARGKSFQDVANQYSIDPKVRQTGGVIGINDVSRVDPGLRQIIESTGEGKTTPWQTQQEGFAKAYVDQKVKAKPLVLDDTQKEVVRRQLALQKGGAASDLPKRLVDKLRASKITVNSKPFQPLWDTAYKAMLEQSAASTAPAGTGGTSVPPTASPTTAGAGAPPAAGRQ